MSTFDDLSCIGFWDIMRWKQNDRPYKRIKAADYPIHAITIRQGIKVKTQT